MGTPGDEDDGGERIEIDGEQFFLAPASESAARAAMAMPTEPSDDAFHVLGQLDLPAPEEVGDDREQKEYGPTESVEWVITATFPASPRLDPKRVNALFDPTWRKQHGGLTIYGRDANTSLWTYLISADGPKAVTELKFAWVYVPHGEDEPLPSMITYCRRVNAVREKLKSLGAGDPTINVSRPVDDAQTRSAILYQLKQRLDRTADIVLAAPLGKTYSGRTVWDVMLCLGLTWGDMDCFHWEDESGAVDHLFSVQTSTDPGYFLPEDMASGEMKPRDLIFGFEIPRTPSPVRVYDAMLRAAEYCQKRLGGTIQNEDGKPIDMSAARNEIAEIERELSASGLTPGSGDALMLF